MRGNMADIDRVLSSAKYDLIWLHKDSLSNIALLRESAKRDIRSIVHAHRSTLKGMAPARIAMHYLQRRAAYLDAAEHWACSKGAGFLFFGNRPFEVMSNVIDVDCFSYSEPARSAIRNELGIDQDEIVIGTVGRLDPVKNHIFLIKVLANLTRWNQKVKLLIVGDGKERMNLESTASSMGLSSRVILTGARSDIPRMLSAMDLFVLPSLTEALSISSLEAQASGLACVIPVRLTQAVPPLTKVLACPNDDAENWSRSIIDLVDSEPCVRTVDRSLFERYDAVQQSSLMMSKLKIAAGLQ